MSNSRVFISGPIGSGKKLIAQLIHQNSFFSKNLCSIIDFKNISDNEIKTLFSDLPKDINMKI